MQPIAYIHTDFGQKFGIPRQSGLAPACKATVTFLPPFNDPDAVRGLGDYSHIWLIWEFQDTESTGWHPLVRPPRLGGSKKVGVFASRSPFRPNPLGLSCVRLERVELSASGPILHVLGADLRNGTPIFDIKPYVPLADCQPQASGGFTDTSPWQTLELTCMQKAREDWESIPEEVRTALRQILEQDPRPAHRHHHSPEKVYRLDYAGYDVGFTVDDALHKLAIADIRRP